ncbi:hypothetical protein F4859DRAFT_510216 [Xylaria cf. heliscus]|nr:hypothetical protein F4859DRAFT_510216 [Xylaria cf. heliscus]
METSRFFRLPLEIRQIIYEYYLTFNDGDFDMIQYPRAYAELRSDVHSTAVLRVPPWKEDGSVFYRHALAWHGVLRIERLRRLFLIIEMDSGFWLRRVVLGGFYSVMERCFLEHLTIDWAEGSSGPPDSRDNPARSKFHEDFLQTLEGTTSLRTVWLYGHGSGYWKQKIEQHTKMNERGVVITEFPYRWWK